jgi:D-glycero-alpha-D-manno-heptose-7-phosphate kinase
MIKVSAQAPTRIDLAGGTLDLWPIHHLLDHKCTVNVGVSLEAKVDICESNDGLFHLCSQDLDKSFTGNFEQTCRNRELPLLGLLIQALWDQNKPALTINTSAKSPAGAGLGGSSCLGITLAGALIKARGEAIGPEGVSEQQLVHVVQNAEARLIHAPTGCQDYWGALRGGVNIIRFPFGGTEVETMNVEKLTGLTDELILCFSGKSRASAINNWEIFKKVFDGDKSVISIFNDIGSIAEQVAIAALAGDLKQVINLSKKEWDLRLKLWPNIVSSETKKLDQAATQAGARFTRVCGAGGGGVMAIFAPKDSHNQVIKALNENGGFVLKANAVNQGLEIH